MKDHDRYVTEDLHLMLDPKSLLIARKTLGPGHLTQLLGPLSVELRELDYLARGYQL